MMPMAPPLQVVLKVREEKGNEDGGILEACRLSNPACSVVPSSRALSKISSLLHRFGPVGIPRAYSLHVLEIYVACLSRYFRAPPPFAEPCKAIPYILAHSSSF